ncbi:MAG: Holliday junction resolvase RuvX [Thermomicrobiales bacterium]|nr:Holliday junction resolvase RuvX [Thermomicrobiales bacterium]
MSSLPGRALGLDVGERRIGMAIADELGLIASPLGVVQRGDGDLQRILDAMRAQRASVIVIGLPMGLSGREGPQAATVRAFAETLAAASHDPLEVVFWDERLTSTVAERALAAQGRKKNRRSGEIDAVAAAVILQGYLDAERNSFRQRPSREREAR